MDVLLLSRLQFAFTIMFHYIFPPLSIGLGLLLVIVEGMYLRTKNPVWEAAARFWTKIFALNFALGVATGIVMEFEFGTNWAAYSRFVGDVFGSALAAEGIFAFFLESGFLAVLVFGWDRVGPKMHFFSTCMVSLGSIFSAVWIVIANSWQQTPAGYHVVTKTETIAGETLVTQRAEITDFWAMVFNPSSMDRLSHVLVGAFILGAFFMMSVSAFYILRNRHLEVAKRCFTVALIVASLFTPLAAITGDLSAKKVAVTQPAKLAAMEGHFKTGEGGTGLYIFGWPDKENQTVYGVQIPGLLSWMVHGDANEPVKGLDQFPPDEHPPVWLPFQMFHLMVLIGGILIVLAWTGIALLLTGKLWRQRWLMKLFVPAVLLTFVANQAGWVAAEVGRQPWIVYPSVQNGVPQPGLRTAHALSESVRASHVLWSIVMFGMIYALLFFVWVYVLNHKIQHGPEEPQPAADRIATHGKKGLFAVTSERVDKRESMTEAKPEQQHRPTK